MKKKKLDTNELMDHMKAKGITFKNPKEKTVKKYIDSFTLLCYTYLIFIGGKL